MRRAIKGAAVLSRKGFDGVGDAGLHAVIVDRLQFFPQHARSLGPCRRGQLF